MKPNAAPTSLAPLEPKPWDKRPDETAQMYACFTIYLLMGIGRSLERCHQQALTQKLVRTTWVRNIKRWSHNYKWVERVQAWDAEQSMQERLRVEQARLSEIEKAARRQAKAGRLMQSIGVRDLKKVRARQQESPKELVLKPSEASSLIVDGSKVERAALGMPTATAISGGIGVQVQGAVQHLHQGSVELDLSGLSDEELEQLERVTSSIAAARARESH